MKKTSSVKIKICGLRRLEDIETVNYCRPDYAGFIVNFPKSFRSVTAEELNELTAKLDKNITAVGVFVNAPEELPAQLLNEGIIGMAQLHGQEDEDYIRRLRKLTRKPLIKAFSVKSEDDIKKAVKSSADYILLDQGSGGTGQAFDWTLIREMNRPFFLAGGIGPDNLERAIQEIHPYAVDLSSSVETDRWKNPEKIRRVVDIVRQNK
ncbi:phosphoribosylanthranilate isomerase [Blautia sp. HCP28S3_G10]|uniref:phosphoribosylanthranilate isomerase n=1 Tax=Blautia sp. HCP28S3_G10 TaxID=3438908 RepID=UPI003F8C5675